MKKETKIYFYKGSDDVIQKTDNPDSTPIDRIQKSFEKVLDGKNLSFLLGSGCSSYVNKVWVEGEKTEIETSTDREEDLNDNLGQETSPIQEPDFDDLKGFNISINKDQDLDDKQELDIAISQSENNPNDIFDEEHKNENPEEVSFWEFEEVGIPTMKPLAEKFFTKILSPEECEKLKTNLGIDVTNKKFSENLEFFLGSLHSCQFFEESIREEVHEISQEQKEDKLTLIRKIIEKVKHFLIDEIFNEAKRAKVDDPVNAVYEKFYRKLLYRNTNLPKPNIFTTNYDLYSETALDRLGIHYVNGFSGGIKKYFNPTIFNYALAERMDLSQNKWGVIDNFFYLYKIHGSINWIQDEEGSKLFKVREIQETDAEALKKKETVMIHPTPLKHNASLGSPYSDLFREFQRKLMQNNNILVTIGYSFSDEHINNLIYQAFTIPSFRLIVMGSPSVGSEIEKLKLLNDPRIWIIGGELDNGKMLHYFEGFVDSILPDLTNDEIDDKIENAIRTLFKKNEQGR